MDTRKASAAAAALVAVLSVGACSSGDSSSSQPASGRGSPAMMSATMMLNWVPNPEHVALFYALDHGYFTDEGLNLEVQTPGNATDTMKLVATSRADVGISFEPALFIANEQGLPVTAVETSVPVPLDSLIALPDSGIQSPSDLAGKKVGNDGLPNDEAVYQTALKTGGLTPDQVTEVQVGFNLVTSLLSHKVDAIVGGFRNVEAIQIEQETGEKPVVLSA